MPSSWEIKLKIRILLNQSEIFFNVFFNLEFFNDREDGVMTFKRFTKIFSEALNLSRCNRFPFKSSTTLNSKKLNKRKWISAHFCQVMSCQLSEDYIIKDVPGIPLLLSMVFLCGLLSDMAFMYVWWVVFLCPCIVSQVCAESEAFSCEWQQNTGR